MRKAAALLAGQGGYKPELKTKLGFFNTGTGTSSIVINDVGFTPKAILFWWSGRTNTTDSVGGANSFRGFGVAISPTERWAHTIFSEDGQTTTDADRAQNNDACVNRLTTTGTIDGLADLASMDANGFTIAIDNNFSVSMTVHYLALGGDAITGAAVGNIQEPGATGNRDITGLAFQPDFVLFSSVGLTITGSGTGTANTQVLGAADAAGNQFTMSVGLTNGNADDLCGSYFYDGEVIHGGVSGAGSLNYRESFVSFLSNGFRLNCLERATNRVSYYLALRGPKARVGNLETRTDGNPIVVSGLGFKPKAAVFGSVSSVMSTQDTAIANAKYSVGAATGPAERGCHATKNQPGSAISNVGTAVEFDAVYAHIDNATDTIAGLMDLTSMDPDGFSCVMDDTDPAANRVGYMAFGDAA